MLLLQCLCQGATQQRGCRGQPHTHDLTVAVCSRTLGSWSCFSERARSGSAAGAAPVLGDPQAHPTLQIWIRGILLRDRTAWYEGKEAIPQRPELLPHGPQSPAEPLHPSPWEDAPRAAPRAEPRARRNDDLRMSWRCWWMPSLKPHHPSLGGIPQEQPLALRHRGCRKQDLGHVE